MIDPVKDTEEAVADIISVISISILIGFFFVVVAAATGDHNGRLDCHKDGGTWVEFKGCYN